MAIVMKMLDSEEFRNKKDIYEPVTIELNVSMKEGVEWHSCVDISEKRGEMLGCLPRGIHQCGVMKCFLLRAGKTKVKTA